MTLIPIRRNDETAVPNAFLDVYMKDANGEFVKVYLHLLRCLSGPSAHVSTSDIADSLNLTEKDVHRALKYWDKVGVLAVEFDENNEPASLAFLPLEATPQPVSASQPVPAVHVSSSQPVKTADEASAADKPAGAKGTLSPARIREVKEREDMKQLLYIVEKYIEKPLSGADINKIIYMTEELHFSSELIEYLVEYCVSNNHTGMNYIQKVALAWFDEGITTVEAAKEHSTIYKKRNTPVLREFGITGRSLTSVEMEFVDRWYDEFAFDGEIIAEACRLTILRMHEPNFNYCEGILKKWRTAKVHTLEDVKKLDSGFRGKISVPVTTSAKPAANQFNNFSSSRTYDFDAMEKKLVNKK